MARFTVRASPEASSRSFDHFRFSGGDVVHLVPDEDVHRHRDGVADIAQAQDVEEARAAPPRELLQPLGGDPLVAAVPHGPGEAAAQGRLHPGVVEAVREILVREEIAHVQPQARRTVDREAHRDRGHPDLGPLEEGQRPARQAEAEHLFQMGRRLAEGLPPRRPASPPRGNRTLLLRFSFAGNETIFSRSDPRPPSPGRHFAPLPGGESRAGAPEANDRKFAHFRVVGQFEFFRGRVRKRFFI